jgi:hypothetical protein
MLKLLTSPCRQCIKQKSIRFFAWLLITPSFIFAQYKLPAAAGNDFPPYFISLQRQAENYYGLRKSRETDSIIGKMIFFAEQSMDQGLMQTALFENPIFLSDLYFSNGDAEISKYYIDRALEYARHINKQDLIAFAHIKLSAYFLATGDLEKADNNASISNSIAMSSENDTAKVMSLVQESIVSQAMSKSLIALKTLYNALDITQAKKLYWLESEVYRALAMFYKKLNDKSNGKELIFKSMALSKMTGNAASLMYDYFVLPQMCPNQELDCQRESLRQAIRLADSLKIKTVEMEARRYLFYTYYQQAPSDTMINMLNRDTKLKEYLTNICPGMLEWTMGQAYLYGAGGANADSALYYMKKAEGLLYMNFVMSKKKSFISELAKAYEKEDIQSAIQTYQGLLHMEESTRNYTGMRNVCANLKRIYGQLPDYENAYRYTILYDQYTEKINEQVREDEMAKTVIDNERKVKERLAEEMLLKKNQAFNLQYTLIAILIFTLFIGLAMMGLYKVSQRTVRLLGFFSFLLLFEFITLISKKWISHITGGTPWQDFLFMIALALVMLPLHNWLEHQIIGYLVSKELLKPHKGDKNSHLPPAPETVVADREEKDETPVRKITS